MGNENDDNDTNTDNNNGNHSNDKNVPLLHDREDALPRSTDYS